MSNRIAEITQRTGKYKEPTWSNYQGESRSDYITVFCSQCIVKRIITVMVLNQNLTLFMLYTFFLSITF